MTFQPRASRSANRLAQLSGWLLPAVVSLCLVGCGASLAISGLEAAVLGGSIAAASVGLGFLRLFQLGNGLLDELDAARSERERLRLAVADLHKAEQAYRGLAYHDPLTGLPNQRLFHDRLGLALKHCSRERTRLAVLYLDVDGFKQVNDSFGHETGDRVLQELANRVCSGVRGEDTVARLGGDEFVVLLPVVQGPEDARHVADKVRAALRMPFDLDGMRLPVSASVGVAVFPDDGVTAEELIRTADAGMYRAKARGKRQLALVGGRSRVALPALASAK